MGNSFRVLLTLKYGLRQTFKKKFIFSKRIIFLIMLQQKILFRPIPTVWASFKEAINMSFARSMS